MIVSPPFSLRSITRATFGLTAANTAISGVGWAQTPDELPQVSVEGDRSGNPRCYGQAGGNPGGRLLAEVFDRPEKGRSRGPQGGRQLLDDEDGWDAQAPFEQTDIVAV